MKNAIKMTNYQCPHCQLLDCDPHVITLVNILNPTLIKNDGKDRRVSTNFSIPPNVNKIIEMKRNENKDTRNFIAIIIRCLRLDEEGYEHHWPLNFSIAINGTILKILTLPKYPPRSKSRVDHPIIFYIKEDDIIPQNNFHSYNREYFYLMTKYLNLNLNCKNLIDLQCEFSKNDNDNYFYCYSIDLVEVFRNTEETIEKRTPLISDVNKLKSYFIRNESILFSEKVNLIDCYTNSQRIKIPARSVNCSHLAVFDLFFFLTINRKNKTYDCPHCRKKATRLYIDGYIQTILNENKEIQEIHLSPDYHIQSDEKFKVKTLDLNAITNTNNNLQLKPRYQKEIMDIVNLDIESSQKSDNVTINNSIANINSLSGPDFVSNNHDNCDSITNVIPPTINNTNLNTIVNTNVSECLNNINKNINSTSMNPTNAVASLVTLNDSNECVILEKELQRKNLNKPLDITKLFNDFYKTKCKDFKYNDFFQELENKSLNK